MGQFGGIYFFTEQSSLEPLSLLRATINVFSPETVRNVLIYPEHSEWEDFLNELNGEEDSPLIEFENLPKTSVADVPSYYQKGKVLSVAFGYPSPLAQRIYEDNLKLPETVRGDFNIWDVGLNLGWHDLFSTADDPQPRLFGRAFFSVRIGGQGSPGNWSEYRQRIWELPAVIDVARKLDPLLTPVKTCAIWSV